MKKKTELKNSESSATQKKTKNKAALPIRHSRTELVILVGIIAILSLLIMFLKYPF